MRLTILGTVLALGTALSFPALSADVMSQRTQFPTSNGVTGETLSNNLIAWEWPWSTPQKSYCFAVHKDYDFFYTTIRAENLKKAKGKVSRQSYLMHEGGCNCEGISATETPPSCSEPEYRTKSVKPEGRID